MFQNAVKCAQTAVPGQGRVEFLMNRPQEGVHMPVDELYFDVDKGIVGDRWQQTAWLKTSDGRPDPRVQVSMTNTCVMQCFTGNESEAVFRCGDNLYTDLSLIESALPVGAQLQVGEAIIEVSDVVNDACGKFVQRFGQDAFKLIRSAECAPLRLRGLFAQIRKSGRVCVGDKIQVL